ncbi:MAG TPA: lytic transglycosylase domain-containing protein [Bryobacteraceae bacterium]|jgi:soluble lytic murein transglycosylase-like protein|nr:lytic transglycosylase domain-containing protein [Bryobacteraceae bacterium]
MRLAAIFLCLATVCSAGEYAVLASGGRLHIDRHQTNGDTVRFFIGDSVVEMNNAKIARFEEDDYTPPPPVAFEPNPTTATTLTTSLAPSPAPASLTAQDLADQAADKYGLPRWLVRSVMKNESGFQAGVVSPKGAIGLMQLMPTTAQALGADAKDPAQNADAGARYLRDLLEKYDGALWHALAAYNAGPGAVNKYRGVPPYSETVRYINRIEKDRKTAEQQ